MADASYDFVSRNQNLVRSLPIWTGGIGFAALLANRTLSGVGWLLQQEVTGQVLVQLRPCQTLSAASSLQFQKRSKPFTMTATVLSMCQVACSAALENVTQQMPSGSAQPATGTYGGLITKATNVVAGYVYDLFCSCRSLLWWMPAAVSHGQMCWVSCCQLCCCSQGCNGWP